MEATPKEWKQMVQSFTSRGASHCDHETFSFKPHDKNLAADSSNSQRHFYHSSDFDSKVRGTLQCIEVSVSAVDSSDCL